MTRIKEKAGIDKLAVEYVPTDQIKPSPKNTRTHPPEQVTQIATSIRRWQKLTGKAAIHADEKKSFDQITKTRS